MITEDTGPGEGRQRRRASGWRLADAHRAGPVRREGGSGQGASSAQVGRCDDEQLIGVHGTPGALAPDPGEGSPSIDGVAQDARQSIAGRLGRRLPGGHRERDPWVGGGRCHVAEHEDHHGIVGQMWAEVIEQLAHERR
jgi:hypothetical protein